MRWNLCVAAILQCVCMSIGQQRVPPGVAPQHYQQQQQHIPQHQQVPQHHGSQQQYQQQQQQQQQYQQQQQQVPQQHQQQHVQHQQQVPVQPVPAQQQQPGQGHGHGHGHGHASGHHNPQVFNPENIAQEKEHIAEHLEVPMDTSKMTEQELQFHYFKMHDADNNNKLDGCELIKSLIHWHANEDKDNPSAPQSQTDDELAASIDPTLKMLDVDNDGYISYEEYRTANLKED